MRIYKLKSNKDLFDEWSKLSKKTSKKIPHNMTILQNDSEMTTDHIKEYHQESLEEIRKVDEEFKSIVQDMMKLREKTIEYLKAQLLPQEKEFKKLEKKVN